jgi:hypothetical protein
MGAFGDMGARLIERGYGAVPIIPGTKRPGVLSNGRWVGLPRWQDRYSKRPPSEFEIAHWCEGDTGIGIVCGSASHGTVAFDVDTDLAEIRATLDAILPGTPVRKVGKRGETLFYFAPHVAASKKWIIDGQTIAELIGPGRQTVIPPTIHPETLQPYRWSGVEGLDALAPDELPLLPVDFVAQVDRALAPFGYRDPEPASITFAAWRCLAAPRAHEDALRAWQHGSRRCRCFAAARRCTDTRQCRPGDRHRRVAPITSAPAI